MESTSSRVAVTVAALAILFLIGYVVWTRTRTTVSSMNNNSATNTQENLTSSTTLKTEQQSNTQISRIQIALLDTQNLTKGKQRGCDRIVMVPYRIGNAQPSLDVAMHTLFSWKDTQVGDWFNFIAQVSKMVSYDHATIKNGIASIYLVGDIPETVGSCDGQRLEAQISETAYQFPTIEKVNVFLNGIPMDVVE